MTTTIPDMRQQHRLRPRMVTSHEAKAFVAHRDRQPPIGHRFSIGVQDDTETLVGVVIVGRPKSQHLNDGKTLEIVRACTDGTAGVRDVLYHAAWQAARALGATRLIVFTPHENDLSLQSADFRIQATHCTLPGWDRLAHLDASRSTSERFMWIVGEGLPHPRREPLSSEVAQARGLRVTCEVCDRPIVQNATGRPRSVCSTRCRTRKSRLRCE